MIEEVKQFTKKIIILSVIIEVLEIILFLFIIPQYYSITLFLSVPIFVAVSIIAHNILLKARDKRPAQFNVAFMLNFGMKIFIYAIFVGIALFFDNKNYISIVINTLILYMIYTIFDVKELLKVINPKKE